MVFARLSGLYAPSGIVIILFSNENTILNLPVQVVSGTGALAVQPAIKSGHAPPTPDW